jgi:hypothetical protein
MDSMTSTILLVLAIVAIGGLLIGGYIIVPIIRWLYSNPIASLGLLMLLCVLVAALVYKMTKD